MSEERGDSQAGLIALLAGIGVGVLLGGAVALLTAPQAGEQTRAQLRESADDALGRLRTSMDELKTKVDELARQTRGGAQSASQEAEGSARLSYPDEGSEGVAPA